MTPNGYLQIGLYIIVLLALAKPLGWYMARVYDGLPSGLERVLGPLERLIYRLCGVHAEMHWQTYATAMLLCTRSASENRNHAAACDSISRAGRREGAASPRRAAS